MSNEFGFDTSELEAFGRTLREVAGWALERNTKKVTRPVINRAGGIAATDHEWVARRGLHGTKGSIRARTFAIKNGTTIVGQLRAGQAAKYLEYGTVNMPPHEFLRPAIDKVRLRWFHQIGEGAVRITLKPKG